MITHIGTVAVYITEQDSALRFWTEQVGACRGLGAAQAERGIHS
jgi:hypothetical protein